MSSERKTAIIVGVLYIIGTIAGILSKIVSWGFLDTPDYLNTIASNASRAQLTAFLILVMGFSLAMMPAVMFPILRRKNEALAVGYVIFRGGLETFTYIASAICWLSLVVVARQYVDSGAVTATQFASHGILLVKTIGIFDGILSIVFSLGLLMFYSALYQARLIPRWISGWGLIGVILYFASGLLMMPGLITSTTNDVLQLPIFLQEMFLAVWLIVKGFDPSAIASLSAKTDTNEVK
ncbi:MAG: DUF4386 domain-containing protein [Candidatus Methanoperedens sp.]|nr:DUF4386 domain-containing protein [Candidatus Methanoperedens sp.]